MADLGSRRPLKSRGAAWAKAAAAALARAGVRPDAISFAGVAFAALGGAALWESGQVWGAWRIAALVAGAATIQLRLVCNLLDGMVAVEHGKGGSAGPIWNELPDRFADVFLLVGAGYGAAGAGLAQSAIIAGWIAAVAAVGTAYVRELGRGLGFPADFAGPMAKPQRMAALTLGCLLSIAEEFAAPWIWPGEVLMVVLWVIALGALATVARRNLTLAARLKAKGAGR